MKTGGRKSPSFWPIWIKIGDLIFEGPCKRQKTMSYGITQSHRLRVLHVITGLNDGGAEGVLYHLCKHHSPNVRHAVVSMRDAGKYGPLLQEKGVPVYTLHAKRQIALSLWFFRLVGLICKTSPDIVQTWMYHADLAGGLATRIGAGCPVVWGIHHSNLDSKVNKPATRAIARLCAMLSCRIPAAIACCSVEAARVHQALGYCRDKFRIIPNGYDLTAFRPDPDARVRVRGEWGVDEKELLLGMVGRWHPQKDHANLMHALARLTETGFAFRCVLVGPMMTAGNHALRTLLEDCCLRDLIILAGPRNDIPAVMNALDMHVLSSVGEAFPNVVAEAMACGTPCVTTDVGDAAAIVGNPDWVAPARAPQQLADAILNVLDDSQRKGRESVGEECRRRIQENYSLDRMVTTYEALWHEWARRRMATIA